ncbi:MAG: hypothetical protein ACRCXZ_10975 [Patescibacteria group bacterium]
MIYSYYQSILTRELITKMGIEFNQLQTLLNLYGMPHFVPVPDAEYDQVFKLLNKFVDGIELLSDRNLQFVPFNGLLEEFNPHLYTQTKRIVFKTLPSYSNPSVLEHQIFNFMKHAFY